MPDDLESDARFRQEITQGLIDLHHCAGPHEQLGWRVCSGEAAQTGPAVEAQLVRAPVSKLAPEDYLLVMAVARRVRRAVDVRKSLGMAEVTRFPERQMERHGRSLIPVRGDFELPVKDEVAAPPSPMGVRLYDRKAISVGVLLDRWILVGAG
jgi:hypothetical protein